MDFSYSVEINKPLNKIIEIFKNEENLKEWQDGFISKKLISGVKGEVGSKYLLLFKNKNNEIELTETIQVSNLPDELTALYEHKYMSNTMSNCFTAIGADKTKYEIKVDYTKFNGFIPRLMAFLMPGVFKKQAQKWIDQFKVFAEKSN